MKITKLGHCCLLLEDKGKTVMTDPGAWTTVQNTVKGVDIVLITHEHPDHFHVESLKTVVANNPQVVVVTNSRVRGLLAEQNIPAVVLEHGQRNNFGALEISGFGTEHATIYPTLPNVMNTGYLIQKRFFYPGDALTNPGVPVEILAMPMIGPWLKLAEVLEWGKEIKPKVCIPVHDGMLQPREWIYTLPNKILPESGIRFDVRALEENVLY